MALLLSRRALARPLLTPYITRVAASTTATDLKEAAKNLSTVEELDLSDNPAFVCRNMMCEK